MLTVLKNNPIAHKFYVNNGYIVDKEAGVADPSDAHVILSKCVIPSSSARKCAEAAGLD